MARKGPVTIAEQGSFFVGGRRLSGAGSYDPAATHAMTNLGNDFWQDQMYVQYQIPVEPREHPLVLIHGGGGTGRVWETTPDGREGYQTIFLRRGFAVYIVDTPRRGRSGYPSFNGPLGEIDGRAIVAGNTARAGLQFAWSRWRIGPAGRFREQQFDLASTDRFLQHLVPEVARDVDVVVDAIVALLERIGPAVLVTHSESGLYGWLAAGRSTNVAGIVSYEPGFVFPPDRMPDPVPLFDGSSAPAGTVVEPEAFAALAAIPVQIVYGDNIPTQPVADLPADGRRAQKDAAIRFAEAIGSLGGRAEILHLPDRGLFGNSHFMFSDLNNDEVADQLSLWLRENGLDGRN